MAELVADGEITLCNDRLEAFANLFRAQTKFRPNGAVLMRRARIIIRLVPIWWARHRVGVNDRLVEVACRGFPWCVRHHVHGMWSQQPQHGSNITINHG